MKSKIFTYAILLILISNRLIASNCGTFTNLTHNLNGPLNEWSWDAIPGATSYTLEIMEAGYNMSNPETITVTNATSFAIAGGILGTSYDWRVISTCPNGNDTSAIQTFYLPCPEPTALNTTNIGQSSALLNWSNPYAVAPYERGVTIAYRELGGSLWSTIVPYTLNQSFAITNLLPGTTYEWCVNLDCNYGFSAPVISQFTTLSAPVCPVVTITQPTNIGTTSVALNWSFASGATGYTILYRDITSSTWSVITKPGAFPIYNLTGLQPNTTYEVKISTICGNTESTESNVMTFTTNCVSLNNSAEWIDYVKIGSIMRTSGAEPNGYSFTNSLANLQAGATYSIQLSAGFSGANQRENVAVFLDVNKNGIFEYSERIVGVGLITNGNIRNYSMPVPSNTVLGVTKLRVVMLRQNQPGVNTHPCVPVGSLGEMEDYTVNITAPSSRISAPETSVSKEEMTEIYTENRSPTNEVSAIFPNPSNGAFTLNSAIPIVRYEVTNQNGKTIKVQSLPNETTQLQISLEVVPDGIYFIKYTDVNGITTSQKALIIKS
jgi:hypothetical protein